MLTPKHLTAYWLYSYIVHLYMLIYIITVHIYSNTAVNVHTNDVNEQL